MSDDAVAASLSVLLEQDDSGQIRNETVKRIESILIVFFMFFVLLSYFS